MAQDHRPAVVDPVQCRSLGVNKSVVYKVRSTCHCSKLRSTCLNHVSVGKQIAIQTIITGIFLDTPLVRCYSFIYRSSVVWTTLGFRLFFDEQRRYTHSSTRSG